MVKSGQTEPLVVTKPLLIEHLVAELTLNPRVGGMLLELVVIGQACLSDS